MHRLKPTLGAYPTHTPETLPIQAPGHFSGLLSKASLPLLAEPVPYCASLFPHAGTPSMRYPRPHYHHTASDNITATDIDMHAAQDKTSKCLTCCSLQTASHSTSSFPPSRSNYLHVPCQTMPWPCSSGFISARSIRRRNIGE